MTTSLPSSSSYRWTVSAVKKSLKARTNSPDNILKDSFHGVSALVVSAGPSAGHWRQLYHSFDKPPLLVCIKQAIELDGIAPLCAMHFCNTWNLKKYSYGHKHVLRLFSSANGDPPSYQSWDVSYRIVRENGGLSTSLAARRNFPDWSIERSGLNRPWGPGIMYETVFYTLVHLGVSSIHTVGWDVADPTGTNHHFYDANSSETHFQSTPGSISAYTRLVARVGRSYAARIWSYTTGQRYNQATMMPGEACLVAESLPSLRSWLLSRNVSIECFTNSEWFPAGMSCRV